MLTILATLFLMSPPPGFTVARDTVEIGQVIWYDGNGRKHVTEQPYLQIRLTVTNDADHPMLAWLPPGPGDLRHAFRRGRGAACLFRPGCRWENSLVTDQVVNPEQKTTILVVFDLPRTGGLTSLELQWKGESPGWNMTVKSGFKLPKPN